MRGPCTPGWIAVGLRPQRPRRAGQHHTAPRPPQPISPDFQAATAHAPQLDLTIEGKWAEDLRAVAWVSLHTHRPHCCGWTGVVRQARTKNLHRLRLRRWHASLSQGPRPCATIWHASSPSLSPHNHALSNHSTSPPSVKVICTDLDHAITTWLTRGRTSPSHHEKS